jgi:hypothetical protein
MLIAHIARALARTHTHTHTHTHTQMALMGVQQFHEAAMGAPNVAADAAAAAALARAQ